MNRALRIFAIAIFAILSLSSAKADLCRSLRTEPAQTLYQGKKQRLAAEIVSHFYGKPTKSLLCGNLSGAQLNALKESLRSHLHSTLIDEFVQPGKCDQLASSRFGFPPLDTKEAISESYTYHYHHYFTHKDRPSLRYAFAESISPQKTQEEGQSSTWKNRTNAGKLPTSRA